jgi:hypothetical protein
MPPFLPADWTSLGTPLPNRASETPTGVWALFDDQLYIAYTGEYGNITAGYPLSTQVRVGSIARTSTAMSWAVVWDGAVAMAGYLHWQPRALWVSGSFLYAVVISAGFNWITPQAYIPAGTIAVIRTGNGTTWTLVQTLHSWAGQNLGTSSPSQNWAPGVTVTAWSDEAGDWLIVGWEVYVNGSGGTFFDGGTALWRSTDGGATWASVRAMRGTYPFTTGPTPGPSLVLAPRRLDQVGYPPRWFMFGGSGGINYSDDQGATWVASTWSGLTPQSAFALRNSGVVAWDNGTVAFAPDYKVSCDFGASFTTRAGIILAPAQAILAPVQFDGSEEIIVAVRDNVDSSTKTALWYSTDGAETFTKLGTLPTAFFVPYYLAWAPYAPFLLLYTSMRDAWLCADTPDGVSTPRALCPALFVPSDPAQIVTSRVFTCAPAPVACVADEEP